MELQAESVQELILKGELPDKYIQNDKITGEPQDANFTAMDIPVIDLGLLRNSSTSAHELVKLRSALSSWGCFQVCYL